MFLRCKAIGLLVGLAFVAGLLGACGPRPEPPHVGEINVAPSTTILVGESASLTITASGTGLQFNWTASRGSLSDPTAPSVLYIAPDSPGPDTVTVEVTSKGGGTVRSITFQVVEPTPTPTHTPSPTVPPAITPTLTATPTCESIPVDTYPFYVYRDNDSPDNHFSFWDGIWEDGGSVGWGSQIDYGYSDNCLSGSTCMCIAYTPTGPKYWVGINWLHPQGNYGKEKGFNLEKAVRLTFWARGERGGEVVTFDMGGLGRDAATCDPLPDTPCPDSVCPSVWITRELSTVWQQYSIDMAGKDLSHVIRGFFVSIGGGSAHTIHLDEIRYESGPPATMTATATLTLTPTCPYQGDTDEATIAQLIQAEAQAVNRESICIIQAIFAKDAAIRDAVSGEEWHDPVARYKQLFTETDFLNLTHFDILPAGPGINGTAAYYTSGNEADYRVSGGEWQHLYNGSTLDRVGPATQYGSDHWTLNRDSAGCWVITELTFNAGHIPFPP